MSVCVCVCGFEEHSASQLVCRILQEAVSCGSVPDCCVKHRGAVCLMQPNPVQLETKPCCN